MACGCFAKCQPAHQENIHTLTHQGNSHREQFGVQHLTQANINMQVRGAGDRTTNLLINRWPAWPPKLKPLHIYHTKCTSGRGLQSHVSVSAVFKILINITPYVLSGDTPEKESLCMPDPPPVIFCRYIRISNVYCIQEIRSCGWWSRTFTSVRKDILLGQRWNKVIELVNFKFPALNKSLALF